MTHRVWIYLLVGICWLGLSAGISMATTSGAPLETGTVIGGATPTATPTPLATATAPVSPTPILTPSETGTPTATVLPLTWTPTPTQTPYRSPTPSPTVPTWTATPLTPAPYPSSTPVPTRTPTSTPTPLPTPACAEGWHVLPGANLNSLGSGLASVSGFAANDVWAAGHFRDPHYYDVEETLVEHWDGLAWSAVPSFSSGEDTNGSRFFSVAVAGPNEAWTVGNTFHYMGQIYLSIIEHFGGSGGEPLLIEPSPIDGLLFGISVVSPADIWAVGTHCVRYYCPGPSLVDHWNGAQWSVVSSPDVGPLNGVAARATDDVWAVGNRNQALHWNGVAWSAVPLPGGAPLLGVAPIAPDDVWAVGAGGILAHWDGTGWSEGIGPVTANLHAVSAHGPNDVWAVGDGGVVVHWNGVRWSVVPSPAIDGNLYGVQAVAANDVWAVGDANGQVFIERYLGPCQSPTPTPTACPPGVFSDVHPADYFYVPVQYLASHGVISGYGDCTFRPYNTTTRAQMTKIVALGFALPPVTPLAGGSTFADVPPGHPFFASIEAVARAGVVSGYNCGGPGEPCDEQRRPYFRPAAEVTRGQLAKIIVGAADWALPDPPAGTFADVRPGTAFYSFVEAAACQGIISGYDCGNPGEPCDEQRRPYYRQGASATRGQIAKIAYLALTGSGACTPPTVTP